MNTKQIALGIGLATILLIIVFIFLGNQAITPLATNKVVIATTIFPLTDIAENIAGSNAHVIQMLPPGASPHSYNLTPQQLIDVSQAQTLFIIGHNLDNWVAEAIQQSANIPTVVVDQGIALKEFDGDEHGHGHEIEDEHEDEEHENEAAHNESNEESQDPHYWLSVPNAKHIASTIAQDLQERDPQNADRYQQNLESYHAKLDQLEAELQQISRTAKNKRFAAIHDAWSYLADQYNFQQVATYEPVEGRQPSIQELQELQQVIRQNNLTTFFTEPQKQSTSATRFLQSELNLTTKTLDPIGGPAPHDSYENLMRQNIQTLATP